MIKEPYRSDKPYGEYFESIVNTIKKHIEENDDDNLILMAGKTGSGKSTEGLHIIDMYLSPEKINELKNNLVSQSKDSFADNQNIITHSSRPRILIFDEANVSKRDAMSKFNKDLLDLYWANRGLNIFHIWCNPSLDIIDMPFIEERINGVCFFPESNKHAQKVMIRGELDSFRYFYYFNKEEIKKIYKNEKQLSNDILSQYRDKAQLLCWFNKYRGILKDVYLQSKDERMINKSDTFRENHGNVNKTIKRRDMEEQLGISDETVRKNLPLLVKDEDYLLSPTGRYRFTPKGVEHLKKLLESNHGNNK